MIISASTRTDIPAFYTEWMMERIREGYVLVRNPYNACQVTKYLLDPNVVDCITLWTKNPMPILPHLEELIPFHPYFFVTITPYGREIEPKVPEKRKVIEAVHYLSKVLGKDSVCVRYDPIILTDFYTKEYHEKAFRQLVKALGHKVSEYVISFVDSYEKTKRNFPDAVPLARSEQEWIAEAFSRIAREYEITIKTCAEGIDLTKYQIENSGCTSRAVMERHLGTTIKNVRSIPDRDYCTCIESKDIGAYNSCLHGCKYCYANFSQKTVESNYKKHDPKSPFLIGQLRDEDCIKQAKQESILDGQIRLDFMD
ncbi:MAG: DUF1848 domain-containing protein [bacterium]|nr:DUF1848 domain-containing protein [bacterium]